MTDGISFGGVQLGATTSPAEQTWERTEDRTFHIAVLGDFSGRSNRADANSGRASAVRPREIDRDNFDQVMGDLGVRMESTIHDNSGAPFSMEFRSFDDFHPDTVFESLPIFGALRELRSRLLRQETFAEAANEVRGWGDWRDEPAKGPADEQTISTKPPPPTDASTLTLDDVLNQTLGKQEDDTGVPPRTGGSKMWQELVKSLVAPHTVPGTDPQQPELVACVDKAIARLMRATMHDAEFRALESLWRGLSFLVRRAETDRSMKIWIVDVDHAEFRHDFLSNDDATQTPTGRLLTQPDVGTYGGEGWALVLATYDFQPEERDATLLKRLAKIAAAADFAVITGGTPDLVGCPSFRDTPDPSEWRVLRSAAAEAAWRELRQMPESCRVGICLPRWLGRFPYGKEFDPIDSFSFEEIEDSHAVEPALLWCHSSFICGYLIAREFATNGWSVTLAGNLDVDGLPLVVLSKSETSKLVPCAEAFLTLDAVESILNHGCMPLVSLRGQDVVRLARFQALSDPLTRLTGPWG